MVSWCIATRESRDLPLVWSHTWWRSGRCPLQKLLNTLVRKDRSFGLIWAFKGSWLNLNSSWKYNSRWMCPPPEFKSKLIKKRFRHQNWRSNTLKLTWKRLRSRFWAGRTSKLIRGSPTIMAARVKKSQMMSHKLLTSIITLGRWLRRISRKCSTHLRI